MDATVNTVSDADLLEAQRQTGWTDHRVAVLEKLWLANYSAAQCACMLGGVTRNAVIGVVNRKQFAAGGSRSQSRQAEPRIRKLRAPTARRAQALPPKMKGVVERPPHVDDLAIPIEQRRTLMQLDADCCHWPVGDPRQEGFFFCGAVAAGDGPYCRAHAFRSIDRTRADRRPPMLQRRRFADAWA
jgi:GcrA cell cycle regulator